MKAQNRHVLCIKNREYRASLELTKLYVALPDKDAQNTGMIRVVDESGEAYLYDASFFIPARLGE